MKNQFSLRAMALAGVCLAPVAVAAQDMGAASGPAKAYDNEIDVGLRYQSHTSPVFGRYTGTIQGVSDLWADLRSRPATPRIRGTWFFKMFGTDLDFQSNYLGPNNAYMPESDIGLAVGHQGTWKIDVGYDAITYTGQNFLSPYTSNGGLKSGLYPLGTPAGTAQSFPTGSSAPGTALGLAVNGFPEFSSTAGTR